MQKQILKQKLLKTTYFIDNQYLNEYVELVTTRGVSSSAFRTQTHHIIPKTYFKHMKLEVDNSEANLIELLYKDHVRAHLLLTKCSTGFLKRNNGYAVRYLLSSLMKKRYYKDLTELDYDHLQEIYENSLIEIEKDDFVLFYSQHSCKETARHFDIGLNLVTKFAKEFKCLKCEKRHLAKSRKIIDDDVLKQYYITDNHTLEETATYFNVSKSTIIRRLNDIEINLRHKKSVYRHDKRSNYTKISEIDVDTFKHYYMNHTNKETTLHFNISMDTLKKLASQLNLSKLKNYNTQEILFYYSQFGLTKAMKKYGISKSHLYRIKNKQLGE